MTTSSAAGPASVEVRAPVSERGCEILTPDALSFVASLHASCDAERRRLLQERVRRQEELDAGALPGFVEETSAIREGDWCVRPAPADMQERKVEITGPVDRKMIVNALNSGASTFMADFEDATSPTWTNVVEGQVNLADAVRRTIELETPDKTYSLGPDPAVLMVRPRGWHLPEKHVEIGGAEASGSLFDFGLYVFHNARELLERGSGPYLYLPKLENRHEARLWADVFRAAEDALGLDRGTIRVTVLIENVLAAFEMDEILWELRDHVLGLNAGRWDYIFSIVKKFRTRPDFVLPDRAQVSMTVPFMRAYTELLVRTCHRRGAHAMGGMAAFVPSRRDPEINEAALAKVREDKTREAGDGFDGTWVAHPDLVPVARDEFDRAIGDAPNQVDRLRDDVDVEAGDLLDVRVPDGQVTSGGVETNVVVGLRYLDSWLRGTGAVTIFNLMEDAATAEISRSQVWQWLRHGARLDDGRAVTPDLVREVGDAELERGAPARELFDEVALDEGFVDFLTLPGYDRLD
jgi:malate synthase